MGGWCGQGSTRGGGGGLGDGGEWHLHPNGAGVGALQLLWAKVLEVRDRVDGIDVLWWPAGCRDVSARRQHYLTSVVPSQGT